MTNARQVQATERLLFLTEKYGEVNSRLAYQKFGNLVKRREISADDLYEELFSMNLKSSALLGKPLYRAVSYALGKKLIDFAPANLDILGRGTNFIISRAFNDPMALLSMTSPLKDLTVSQLRGSVVQNYDGDKELVRVANSGSCEWCADLDGEEVFSSDISGHTGCGCYIGTK